MANVKITELANLTDPSTTDVMPVVDVDADVTKKVSVGEVVGKISGDVNVATDGTSSIASGVIVDADISDSAEIAVSKLADGTTRQLLQTDSAGTGVEWTSNVDVPGTLDVTGATTLDSTLDVSGDATVGGDLTVTGDLTVEGATTTLETQTVTVEDKNIELGVVGTPTDTTADGGGITLKGATDKTINWVDATDAWTFSEHVDIASAKEFRIAGTKVLDATSLGSAVVNSSLTSVGTLTSGELGAGFTTVATAQGGTGQTTYADGELLIGKTDGTLAKATLTGGTGVDVTNADGSVTVAIDSTVVTTSDTGTVTSTMILDGTIVNSDINASAAIADTKLDTISTAGKVSNSATTATDANTASAIVARDASGDFTAGTITADLTGNADTATALETARDIGGVSFDGTANIDLPGVNTTGNQDTSGNAATATKLDSSRTFAVTGDVTGTVSSDLTSGASIATSIASGAIVDADVNASAAIAGTKIDPDFGSQIIEAGSARFFGGSGTDVQVAIGSTGASNDAVIIKYDNANDRLQFYNWGASASNQDTFVIDNANSRVGLGVASPSYQLELSADSAGKPSTNTWTIVSDERIKEDIELANLDICYDAIKNIPLKRFKWKDTVYTEEQVPDRHKLGWIAQDVESVFPKAVRIHEFKYNQVFEETVIPAVEEELDEDGNVITPAQPERIEKGELISEDVIEDCRDLNADQLYAAMYGAIQKLIQKVELLEAEISTFKNG